MKNTKIKDVSLVITTINKPENTSINKFFDIFDQSKIIVVGDLKTPQTWTDEQCHYLSLKKQNEEFEEFSRAIPKNAYSRKNLGYLKSISLKVKNIFETDDDNFPYSTFKEQLNSKLLSFESLESDFSNWINIYAYFTDQKIWPRGFPLEHILSKNKKSTKKCFMDINQISITQFLADGDSDVDAIYRLVSNEFVNFKRDTNIVIKRNSYCPFNSQNTLWYQRSFPLMYIPSFVSFRMCDIWRSFIALRCIHEQNSKIIFSSPTLYQERNYHNLSKDFIDEIDGYKGNIEIVEILKNLNLTSKNVKRMILSCYEELALKTVYIKDEEIDLLKLWLNYFDD